MRPDRRTLVTGLSAAALVVTAGVAACGVARAEDFGAVGDGRADDLRALEAALAADGGVVLAEGRIYAVSAPLRLPAGKTLEGTGTLVALPGRRVRNLLLVSEGATVRNISLDGGNVVAPGKAWDGVDATGALIFCDGSARRPVGNWTLENLVFRNGPSGAIYATYGSGGRVQGCRAISMQRAADRPTGAVIEFYRLDSASIRGCRIEGYAWKGYSLNRCRDVEVSTCTTRGGSPGQAAHYMDVSENCAYLDCRHTSGPSRPSFGFKSHQSNGVRLIGYRAEGAKVGAFVQGGSNFLLSRIDILDARGAGVMIEAAPGSMAVADGRVEAVRYSRSSPGTTLDDVALRLAASPGFPVSRIQVTRLTAENALIGVWAVNGENLIHEDISIAQLTTSRTVQYSVLAFATSLTLQSSTLQQAGAFPAITVASNPGTRGRSIVLSNNVMQSAGGPFIEIGGGFPVSWEAISISRNRVKNGTRLVALTMPSASDRLGALRIEGNTATSLSGDDAMSLDFNPASRTVLTMTDNALAGAKGGYLPFAIKRARPAPADRIANNRGARVVGL